MFPASVISLEDVCDLLSDYVDVTEGNKLACITVSVPITKRQNDHTMIKPHGSDDYPIQSPALDVESSICMPNEPYPGVHLLALATGLDRFDNFVVGVDEKNVFWFEIGM